MGFLIRFLGVSAGFNPLNMAIAAALIAAVSAATGFAAGWKVNGWRLGVEIERLGAENALVRGVNQRCKVDVEATQAALAGFYRAQDELAAQVKAAMERATGQAAAFLRRADDILSRPPVPPEKWCETIMKEQADYVRERRAQRLKEGQ